MAVLCFFGAGTIFAALGAVLKKGRSLWTLLSAMCVTVGLLAGLALGQTLNELLSPVLVICAVSMAALLWTKGGDGE